MPAPTPNRWHQYLAVALCAGLGLGLTLTPLGSGLERLSYDLPFALRQPLAVPEVVIVYLDDEARRSLGQPPDRPWDRGLNAQLLDRLTREGARAVLFDLIFDAPGPEPAADEALALALRQNGQTVLSAGVEMAEQRDAAGTAALQRVQAPLPSFRAAAAGWGLAGLEPDAADWAVRRLFEGTGGIAPATTVLAQRLGAPKRAESGPTRWLNPYGPANWIASVSFDRALAPDGLPPGFFHGRIVLIGGRSQAGVLGAARDDFAGPLTRWGAPPVPGVEVQATALLNQLRGDWLERLPAAAEVALLLGVAAFAGLLLPRLTPGRAALVGSGAAIALALASILTAWHARLWWPWVIAAGVQLPVGLAWSLGVGYFTEARRRAALRRAFGLYLSPHMAEKIAATEFDLTPGGQLVEATVMFTDLAGFTALTEELGDPAALSALLIRYYTRTTACLLAEDGTIIKYMGDAVEAVWNAPVPDPAHALRACRAADQLRQVARFEVEGRVMVTRIGIHTGPAFAGNLGSAFRFDYAVIGDTTNFAARLEALNKRLGTEILLSEATRAQTGKALRTRSLGFYGVAGKTQAVEIHELLGLAGGPGEVEEPWLASFHAGLAAFQQGDLAAAATALERARAERAGGDGPSDFLLAKIEELTRTGLPSPWTGTVEFASK